MLRISSKGSSLGALLLGVAASGCGSEHVAGAQAESMMDKTMPATTSAAAPATPSGSSAGPNVPAPVTTTESPLQPAQLAPASGNGSSPEPAKAPPPAAPPASTEVCNLPGAASAATPTIWVIGDSTASVYAANLYPRMGWAQPLQDFFAPACATIQDRAISGRSSKSFFDEGAWTPVRDALKSGDFVLIQFGHNDEKSEDPLRFTEPFTTFEQYLSTYIDDALGKGATPILLTPINRNDWAGAVLDDTHGQYPVAMRQLAETRHVALVDTTALTKSYFERIGQTATTLLFMDLALGQFPNYPDGNVDNTHLQEGGARTIARIILADLARQALPIAHLVKQSTSAPD